MAPRFTWPGWDNAGSIGKGSFGEVYEIQRNVFGKVEKAALKVISIPKNSSDVEELISDGYNASSIAQKYQGYLEEIANEYSLMADMKGSSYIVDCDDLFYEPQESGYGWHIYLKMELLTPLTKVIDKAMTEEQVIKLGKDMCHALILCQNRKIIHRDIKPQNIFVSKDGQYKLGDFGIAKVAEKTANGTKAGTFRYMAPEVYNNQPYGFQSDLYSLGIVLYWLLNERRTPFLPLPPDTPTSQAEDEARIMRFSGVPVPPPLHGSDELKKIVCKACAFNPSDRYASAAEMLKALQNLGLGKKPSIFEKIKEYISSHIYVPIAAAAVVIIAAAVIAVTTLFSASGKPDGLAYPTERTMMSDAAGIMKDIGISGYITDFSVKETKENEKYRNYTVQCVLYVKDGKKDVKYDAVLVYEQNDGEWELNKISRIKT